MDWKLQMLVVPVSDVDRAKSFYVDRLGWHLDVDHDGGEHFRVVQVTPPGSACSISFGLGMGDGQPGSLQGLHLVVTDAEAAHRHLEEAGVENSGLVHFVDGRPQPGADPDHADYNTFIHFSDPDGNTYAVQEVASGER